MDARQRHHGGLYPEDPLFGGMGEHDGKARRVPLGRCNKIRPHRQRRQLHRALGAAAAAGVSGYWHLRRKGGRAVSHGVGAAAGDLCRSAGGHSGASAHRYALGAICGAGGAERQKGRGGTGCGGDGRRKGGKELEAYRKRRGNPQLGAGEQRRFRTGKHEHHGAAGAQGTDRRHRTPRPKGRPGCAGTEGRDRSHRAEGRHRRAGHSRPQGRQRRPWRYRSHRSPRPTRADRPKGRSLYLR